MASNKWVEPTYGFTAARPDPLAITKLVEYAKQQQKLQKAKELYNLAYSKRNNSYNFFMNGNTPQWKIPKATDAQYLAFYDKVMADPEAYRSQITNNIKSNDPMAARSFNYDSTIQKLTNPDNLDSFDWNGSYSGTSWKDATNPDAYARQQQIANQPSILGGLFNQGQRQTPLTMLDYAAGKQQPIPPNSMAGLASFIGNGLNRNQGPSDWIVRNNVEGYKTSTNNYFEINPEVAKKLGLTSTSLYDPSQYENPDIFRYFDSPSTQKRNSGRFDYGDSFNNYGGQQYIDDTAKFLFDRYGLTQEQINERYGQLTGVGETDLPLVQKLKVNKADGTTSEIFFTPYDFAMMGVAQGTNSYMPAKPLDWWTTNATPVNLGKDFALQASKSPYKFSSATPNIGFISSMNPLEMNDADLAKFRKEFGNDGDRSGEVDRFKDGMYIGSTNVRQSYKDSGGLFGGGVFGKIASIVAPIAVNFIPGMQGWGGALAKGALSGAVGSIVGGGDLGKGLTTGLISGGITQGLNSSGFGKAFGLSDKVASSIASGAGTVAAPHIVNAISPREQATFSNSVSGNQNTQVATNSNPEETTFSSAQNTQTPAQTQQPQQVAQVSQLPSAPYSTRRWGRRGETTAYV